MKTRKVLDMDNKKTDSETENKSQGMMQDLFEGREDLETENGGHSLSVQEQKDIDWYLEKKIGKFSGENWDVWQNFVSLFEKAAVSKGWDRFGQETLVELLSGRLSDTARLVFDEWVLEDPEVAEDYCAVKTGLPKRSGEKKTTWKMIVDFSNLKMSKEEKIVDYSKKYVSAAKSITMEELQACKFLFSLPIKVRELFTKYSGEWPRNLEGMVILAQELVLRAESIYVDIGTSEGREARSLFTPRKLICFGCQGEGHYVARCPKRTDKSESKTDEKSNSIKDNLNKYSSSVYLNVNFHYMGHEFQGKALVDSGATANFVSEKWVEVNGLFRSRSKESRRIQLAAGEAMITIQEETDNLLMKIGKHEETIRYLIVPGLHEEVILGKPWLDKHNPSIDWPTGEVLFERCQCLLDQEKPVALDEFKEPELANLVDNAEADLLGRKCAETPIQEETLWDGESSDEDWMLSEDEELDDLFLGEDLEEDEVVEDELCEEKICLMEAVMEDESTEFVRTFLGENKETWNNMIAKIPVQYRDYAELFSEKLADELPPFHSRYQCAIEFKKDAVLPKPQKPYPVSFRQRTVVEQFVNESLRRGTLRKSKSPIAMPMFLVPKKDGDARPVVDLRLVNEIMVDNRNPMPCIDDIMNYLSKARIFSKIDLANAYNLIRIREGDEWKTAFVCHLGQFEFTVMPFGIKTAPAIFQSMMNEIFSDLLGVTVLIYLDDILIFSENEGDHVENVREVLKRLKVNRLLAKLKKCLFHVSEVEFLGYVVSTDGVKVAEDKVSTIVDWPKPMKRQELKSFLGTANFNRKFIVNYSDIVAPLLALDSKSVISFKDAWDAKCDEAFAKLKLAMSSTPVLRHINFELPFFVETDASNYALGAVLLQPESLESSIFHPVAYASRKLSKAERNYSAYDKELLGIIFAFGKWHQFLYGALHQVKVLTDHSNLQYFRQRHLLNNRHINWKLFLQNYDFKLSYRPGSGNVVADALSRRADLVGEVNGTSGTSLSEKVVDIILPEEYWEEDSKLKINQMVKEGSRLVESESERRSILEKRHDNLTAGHFGRQRTYELIRRDFYWPKMKVDIDNYVKSCVTCQKVKSSKKKMYGKLMPIIR